MEVIEYKEDINCTNEILLIIRRQPRKQQGSKEEKKYNFRTFGEKKEGKEMKDGDNSKKIIYKTVRKRIRESVQKRNETLVRKTIEDTKSLQKIKQQLTIEKNK